MADNPNLKLWPEWFLFIEFHFKGDWALTPQCFSNKEILGSFMAYRKGVTFLFITLGMNRQTLDEATTLGFVKRG